MINTQIHHEDREVFAEQVVDQPPFEMARDNVENGRWSRIARGIGNAISGAFVALEVNPLTNEAARLTAFGATQAAFENPLISAGAFTATTMAIEGAGSVAMARLLETEKAQRVTDMTSRVFDRLKLGWLLKTNPLSEAAIAMTAGSPATVVVKNHQNPERTRAENMRYGLITSAGVSLATGAESLLGAEGIAHPNPVTVGAALFGAGALAGSYKWAKNKLNWKSKIPEMYEKVTSHATTGPQIEGLSSKELKAALEDPETEYIKVPTGRHGKDEQLVDLPLMTPMKHATWLNSEFFSKRGYDTDKLMVCTLPQGVLDRLNPQALEITMSEISRRRGGFSMIVDHPALTKTFYEDNEEDYVVDPLITSQYSPAATYHYRTTLTPWDKELAEFQPDEAAHRVHAEDIDTHFERIWEIYSTQFKALVDDHPILGAIPKDDLLAVFKSEGTRLTAYFDDNDTIQAFGYIVDDLSLCPWLNEKYLEEESEGLPMAYMPGIATAPEVHTPLSGSIMRNMLAESFASKGEFTLYFECSNISAKYIPRLVRRALPAARIGSMSEISERRHLYEVVSRSERETVYAI